MIERTTGSDGISVRLLAFWVSRPVSYSFSQSEETYLRHENHAAKRAGAAGYLLKPFNRASIAEILLMIVIES